MRVYSMVSKVVRGRPWAVVAVSLLLTAGLAPGLAMIKGEVSQQSMLPAGFPSNRALSSLRSAFDGASYEQVLIEAPRITDNRITRFLIGLEDFISEDPSLRRRVASTPGEPASRGILGKPVPVVQHYLTPFIANVKRGIASSGFDVSLSEITVEQIRAQTGKDFRQTVEEDYLSEPRVREQMVGEQKFLTADLGAALMLIKQEARLSDSEQVELADDLEELFRSKLAGVAGLTVHFSGDATLARDFERHIESKTVFLFLLSVALVLVTLFLAFRRFTDALVPIGVMLVALVWTFGLMGYVGVPYSIAAVAIIPVLLGHALTFVVPYVARYYEEEPRARGAAAAVARSLTTVGVALFPAAATSVVGFLVFLFSVLPPLKNFGITSAIGTALLFLLSVTLLPAVMVLRDRRIDRNASPGERQRFQTHFDGFRRRQKRSLFARFTDRSLEWSSSFSTRRSSLVVGGFVALIILGFAGTAELRTDSDLRELIPRDLPSIEADHRIESAFGPNQADFMVVRGDVLEPASLRAMLAFEDAVASDPAGRYRGYDPAVDRTVSGDYYGRGGMKSVADVVMRANGGEMPPDRPGVEAALRTAEANGGYVGGVLAADRRHALISLNGRAALSDRDIRTKVALLERHGERHLAGAGLLYQPGGITLLTNDMTRNIIPTETWSSILSLLICGLLLMLIFRSVPYGIITLSVAFAGAAAELGFLWLMDWPIDVITSLVSALVIAVGSNFGILFTHRYLQAVRDGEANPDAAIRDAVMNLGRANVAAALAACAGFLIIMLSQIEPLKRFGGVTAFGIFWSLLASLTLLPALLHLYSARWVRSMADVPETAGAR